MVAPVAVLGLVAATALSGKPYGGLLHALAGSGWSLAGHRPLPRRHRRHRVGRRCHRDPRPLLAAPARWRRRSRALVIVDLLVFTANQSSLAPVHARALDTANPLQAQLAARLGPGGRYLIVDPRALGRRRSQPDRRT